MPATFRFVFATAIFFSWYAGDNTVCYFGIRTNCSSYNETNFTVTERRKT